MVSQGTSATGVAASPVGDPAAVYRALRDQRAVLGDQMRSLQNDRSRLVRELASPQTPSALKPGLEKRLTLIDARIADLDQQIARSDLAVAQAAAVPGATLEPPARPHTTPDPDMVAGLSFVVVLVFAIPLSIAYARRIWRRAARAEVVIAPQLMERMEQMERGVEAIALEVERIGEGQRFITQALIARGEGAPVRVLGADESGRENRRDGGRGAQ